MKKCLLTFAVVILAVFLMAGASFGATISAAVSSANIASSGNPACDISLSKNVSFGYTPNASSNAQSYAIQSYHTSGNKAYGTASDTTLMYWVTDETGDDVDEPGGSDSSLFGSWTSM